MPGNRQRRGFNAQLTVHFCRGTLDGLPADDRRDGNDRLLYALDDTNDGINTDPGVGWADDDRIRSLDRFADPGSGFRRFDSLKPKTSHTWLAAAMYEILLKCEVAFIGFNNRSHRLIRH